MPSWPSPAASTRRSAARPIADLTGQVGRTAARSTASIDRLNLPGLYRTFDFPDPNATSPGRDTTTVAPQALFLMNHPFVLEIGRRAPAPAARSPPRRTAAAAWPDSMRPSSSGSRAPDEQAWAAAFLAEEGETAASWRRYAQALLLCNEFSFID